MRAVVLTVVAALLLSMPYLSSAQARTAAGSAIHTYRLRATVLGTPHGITISGDGFGSAIAPVPGRRDEYYGLSDRGPNVDGPVSNAKVFPVVDYHPAIGRFRLRNGRAEMLESITLRDASGAPLSGLVPPLGAGNTGETAFDGFARPIAARTDGVDPEGLVALADGTFWVSEEYAPSLIHFAANGRLIERVTPFGPNALGHVLPAEFAYRIPNRGFESLAVTLDGCTLVVLTQSALANGISVSDAKSSAVLRLLTYAPATGETHQYIYLLEDPGVLSTMTSDMTAVTDRKFLVVEQDIKFPGAGSRLKGIFEIDLDGATDLLSSRRPEAMKGGAVQEATLEKLTRGQTTEEARATLAGLGIQPVAKRLWLDLDAVLLAVDSSGRVFAHDKVEGIAIADGGRRVVLANDSDFGISSTNPPSARIASKIVPSTGSPDYGEFIVIDVDRLKLAGLGPSAASHAGNQ